MIELSLIGWLVFFSSPVTVDKLNSVFELSITPQLTVLESAQYIQRGIMSDMGISSTVVLNLYVFIVFCKYEEFNYEWKVKQSWKECLRREWLERFVAIVLVKLVSGIHFTQHILWHTHTNAHTHTDTTGFILIKCNMF